MTTATPFPRPSTAARSSGDDLARAAGAVLCGFIALTCAVLWWKLDIESTIHFARTYLPLQGRELFMLALLPTALELAIVFIPSSRARYLWLLWPLAGMDWATDAIVLAPPFRGLTSEPAIDLLVVGIVAAIASFGFQNAAPFFAREALAMVDALPSALGYLGGRASLFAPQRMTAQGALSFAVLALLVIGFAAMKAAGVTPLEQAMAFVGGAR